MGAQISWAKNNHSPIINILRIGAWSGDSADKIVPEIW